MFGLRGLQPRRRLGQQVDSVSRESRREVAGLADQLIGDLPGVLDLLAGATPAHDGLDTSPLDPDGAGVAQEAVEVIVSCLALGNPLGEQITGVIPAPFQLGEFTGAHQGVTAELHIVDVGGLLE